MQMTASAMRKTNQLLQMAMDYLHMAHILRQRAKWQKKAMTALSMGLYTMAQGAMAMDEDLKKEFEALQERRREESNGKAAAR